MRVVKALIFLALLGAIVGDVTATFVAPGMLTWYASPGGAAAALCDCAKLAHEISTQLIRAQSIGAVAGAVVFFVLGIVFKAGRDKKPIKVGSAASGPTPGGTGSAT